MIYDTFMFFDELELLDLRLHELHEVVDKFVLVESTRTQSNQPKPLHFALNERRFASFADKIIHIVVEDSPDTSDAWAIEHFQRDCISRGLHECQPSDIVLMSDLDEIPRADKVRQAISEMCFHTGIIANWLHLLLKKPLVTCVLRRWFKKHHPFVRVFEQKHYTYYINWLCEDTRWKGTRVVFFRDWGLPHELRRWSGVPVRDGGWHFTWMGGAEGILQKLLAAAHQELNTPENANLETLQQRLDNLGEQGNLSLFGKKGTFRRVPIDETFPRFLRDNLPMFQKWIKEPKPETPQEKALR